MCVARTLPECRILSHAVNVRTAPRLSKHPLTSISKARACVLRSDSRSEIADDLGSRAPRAADRAARCRERAKSAIASPKPHRHAPISATRHARGYVTRT